MNYHQDWTPVVLEKIKVSEMQKKHGPRGTPKILGDQDVFKHKEIPKSLTERIKQRRIELKLTQDQLAQKINVRPAVVKNIESCIGPYDHVNINKIMRAIGLTLKGDS
jgi:ribosome-binding protein aMBF1 (putative translation factor)